MRNIFVRSPMTYLKYTALYSSFSTGRNNVVNPQTQKIDIKLI